MHELTSTEIFLPSGRAALLWARKDEGPMRTALDVSQKRTVGRYASLKNGRGQFWESRNELHAFYGAEVSTRVLKYRAQPHTLEMAIAGKKRSYTPDRMDYLVGGCTEIVEIKDVYKPEKDPHYHTKLEMARAVYGHLGWSFRITTRKEIEAQPKFEATKYIQSFRRTVVTARDEDLVIDLLMRCGCATLEEVRALWSSPALGFAKMCALMVKRTINIAFEDGVSKKTPVYLVAA